MKTFLLLCILVAVTWPLHAADVLAGSKAETTTETLKVPGGQFEIVWHNSFTPAELNRLREWLRQSADTASLINGEFPRTLTRVEVLKAQRGTGPVPWAQTIRHTNPEGVRFHVDASRALDVFQQDWTAVHEFSHLYLPYPGRSDIWLSEGFATYYQNLLMARAGILDPTSAWQKLADGFKRGAATKSQLSMAELSQNMRKHRAFMRVYWTGVHYYLTRDILLREQGASLDEVILKFVECCRDKQPDWSGRQLAEKFDELSGTRHFSDGFLAYRDLTSFPDYRHTLDTLGVETGNIGVQFHNTKQSAIRDQLLAKPASIAPSIMR